MTMHTLLPLTVSRRTTYTVSCECGWTSGPCITPHDATRAGDRHVEAHQ